MSEFTTRMSNHDRIGNYQRQRSGNMSNGFPGVTLTPRQLRRIRKNTNKDIRDTELDAIELLSQPISGAKLSKPIFDE